MTNPNALPIYHKLFIFTKLLYRTVHNMKREYKYTIGSEAISLCWQCLDALIQANALPNRDKYPKIKELSVHFDRLKLRLRMMQEIKVVSIGQFTHWQENYLTPAGNQLGGWLKWANDFREVSGIDNQTNDDIQL